MGVELHATAVGWGLLAAVAVLFLVGLVGRCHAQTRYVCHAPTWPTWLIAAAVLILVVATSVGAIW